MTTSFAARHLPAAFALVGFAVAGGMLAALDVSHPAAAVTETISAHAATAARTVYVLALLASCAGVTAALVHAVRSRPHRTPRLALLALWPLGIGLATLFDQDEHAVTVTGTVHNVAVGTALVGVHVAAFLAARRPRSRPLLAGTGLGAACMVVLLGLIAVHTLTGADLAVGAVERVLVGVSAVLVVATLRRGPGLHPVAVPPPAPRPVGFPS